ncbi:WD repeat-containing protein 3-like [Ornithodoros turicata]|uniref:WD repeat-containing protein 3-like n=1 Tax=Ornithodoros turicata TaxID=34597 RepID=UPI003138AE2B
MGLTHDYQRYISGPVFGALASADACIKFTEYKNTFGRYYAVTACEDVHIWDTKTKQKALSLRGVKHEATCLEVNPDGSQIAVGYADGAVRVFETDNGEVSITFQGHKAPVTCLDFSRGRLVSGGKDAVIILWDVVSEAGLFRLKGHKGVVTRCRFMKSGSILISSSKDTFVKFWDLDTQHCFKTLVGHRSEVWDFVLLRDDLWLVTGCADSELRFWTITSVAKEPAEVEEAKKTKVVEEADESEDDDGEKGPISCTRFGSVVREGKGRVCTLVVDPAESLMMCHGTDSLIEVFKLNDEETIKKRVHKREKKERKKKLKDVAEEDLEDVHLDPSIADIVERLQSFRSAGKPCSVDVHATRSGLAKAVVAQKNNAVDLYALSATDKSAAAAVMESIRHGGHRTDVRTLTFSSDNTAVLSASGETVKIWSRSTQQCIRTIECDYALCSLFLPGDRHCIIGTKTGKLQLFDIAAGSLLDDIEAHEGPVWSICSYTDQRGIVSGSGAKEVKFWDYDVVDREGAKIVTLVHARTLKLTEDVLCVKLTPNGKLLAVSLMDSTVKVFFVDTLKFFLSMYGHKFPVLCMDISFDSKILATGSADRNVKLWGLDFGDCHKSIFAHDDSIMCLQFVPKTHLFFTGGKDRMLKQWDADNFQKVMTLEGHQGEIWALCVSPNGVHVATASHDKSIRLWQRSEEPLILEEEQEMEREAEFEANTQLEESVIPREGGKDEVALASKKTPEMVQTAERLMEALDIFKEEKGKLEEIAALKAAGQPTPVHTPHPLFVAYGTTCPHKYMLQALKRVKFSELEETLLVLPFSYTTDLLRVLSELLERGWEVELCCRSLFFLLKVHSGQITTTSSMVGLIDKLRRTTLEEVNRLRDTVGFNLAGLRVMQTEVDAREDVALFMDATNAFKEKRKKRQKKERAILSLV